MATMFRASRPATAGRTSSRRAFLVGAAACASMAAAPVLAADYPDRALKLIVPTTPGSLPDIVARVVGERLAGALGQAVVVDNRPGGGGTIGLQAVARAAPDGYTLGLQTLSFVITPSLIATMPYDTERDLRTVTLLNWNHAVVLVRDASPIRTLADLVAQSKAHPGGLTYSSPGNATPAHLVMALLAQQSGASLVHVPYKGGPAAQNALLAGEVDVFASAVAFAATNAGAGKVRPLAISSPRRADLLREVPTFAELGFPGVELTDWQGIVVPAAAPQTVVDRLHAALALVLSAPDIRERLIKSGLEPAGLGPTQFAEYQRADMRKWHARVREAGIRGD